jgi:tetratricopeptide (TPR) repeat protein
MGELIRTGLKTLATAFILSISFNAFGQVQMTDVVEAFNQGVQMMKTNPDAAIASFESAIELADEVDTPEASELKTNALQQIPKLYYDSARAQAGKKEYESAIEKLEACVESAEKILDMSQASKAKNTILSIINAQGNTALNAKDYNKAIGYYDQALARKSTYAKAYLGKVLAYDGLKDMDKFEENALLGIEAAKSSRDNKTAGTIQQKMRSTYFNTAQRALQNEDFASAEYNLLKAIQYGNTNAIAHYQLGLAYEGQKKWTDAINSFTESVEMDMGSDEDKAKVYFKLGTAYQELGNTAKACESYKKSIFGEFAESSKYQIETVLNCGN